jgi:hypothetical protein
MIILVILSSGSNSTYSDLGFNKSYAATFRFLPEQSKRRKQEEERWEKVETGRRREKKSKMQIAEGGATRKTFS